MKHVIMGILLVLRLSCACSMNIAREQSFMGCVNKNFYLRVHDGRDEMLFTVKKQKMTEIITELTPRLLVKDIQALNRTRTTLTTCRGAQITVEFFENGCHNAIVVGLGAWEKAEDIYRFVKLLSPNFDVITVQYEWHNWSALKNAWYSFFHCDGFFENNPEEIEAIVDFLRQNATYHEIVGIGVCYTAMMMAWAQARCCSRQKPLFTKLILDSVPYSARTFFEALMRDPSLGQNPEGSEPGCWRRLGDMYPLATLRRSLLSAYVSEFCVAQWLAQITNVSILFVRGMNDQQVSPKDFSRLWNATSVQKIAFLTPYHHANNFKWEARALYTYVVQNFVEQTFDDFVANMTSAT